MPLAQWEQKAEAMRDNNGKFRRRRLTKIERAILVAEYERDPEWSKDTLRSLAEKIGTTVALVFKWHYDYWRKLKLRTNAECAHSDQKSPAIN